jgi:hypothetical protein
MIHGLHESYSDYALISIFAILNRFSPTAFPGVLFEVVDENSVS